MPYLRRDRDRFPEEVYWSHTMGPLTAVSLAEPQDKGNHGLLKPMVSQEADGEHVEEVDSEPPTPPDRPGTPLVTISPCPVRLTPLIPPTNYGAVEPFTIYRSGKPVNCNVDFLESLKIRSILTLVDVEVEAGINDKISEFVSMFGIDHQITLIQKNKGELKTTTDSLCEALLFVMNPINHPVYIHCNMGKHRTGCVVACLRKCQQWPLQEVLSEYMTYAADKAREKDIELIKAFDPACVYEYAKKHNRLNIWPCAPRQNSVANIWEMVASLPAHELSQIPGDDDGLDMIDDEDDSDDDGLTMKRSPINFNDTSNDLRLHHQHDSVADVSVMELEDGSEEDHDVQMTESMATTAANANRPQETVALYRTTSTQVLVVSATGSRI